MKQWNLMLWFPAALIRSGSDAPVTAVKRKIGSLVSIVNPYSVLTRRDLLVDAVTAWNPARWTMTNSLFSAVAFGWIAPSDRNEEPSERIPLFQPARQ